MKIHFLTDQQQVALKPQKVAFKITYHPYINNKGSICLHIIILMLPALLFQRFFNPFFSLLHDPNPDDPLISETAQKYKAKKTQQNILG